MKADAAVRARRLAAPSSSPPALAGLVDLLAVEPALEPEWRHFEHESVLSTQGVELRFDTRRVRFHVTRDAVTFAFGRPRIDGREASAEQLDRTLSESLDPWSRIGERFAIVRLDLAAGELLLATDRFGVWPLVWSREEARIAFSDRADFVPTEEPRRLDPQALFDYVYFHVIPAPRTAFRGVHRLEPATALHLSCRGERRQPTWQTRFAPDAATAPHAAEAFRTALREAVRTAADGEPVGCFLSGGTDSSTVAGTLARTQGDVRTFSIGFDAEGYDEMSYARIAARHFGTDHHEYYVTPDDLVRAIPPVAAHYDQPFGNSSAVPAYYCALVARHHGVRRLLAGDGGDELFGGNVRYGRQSLFEAYGRVPAALRIGVLEPLLDREPLRRLPLVGKAASYVAQARVPMPARMETYNLLGRFGPANVFTPSFLSQVDPAAPARLQSQVYARSAGAALVDRMLAYDWRFTLADNDLPKVTGTTRLAGVEAAFPLLADAIVDLSLTLAPRDKVDGRRLRPFFKRALADLLPAEIIAKKKHGFGLPVGPWLVTSPALRALSREALDGLADRGVVRRALVDDLFSRRLEEHAGYYGEMVWVLTMLEHWLRARAPAFACR